VKMTTKDAVLGKNSLNEGLVIGKRVSTTKTTIDNRKGHQQFVQEICGNQKRGSDSRTFLAWDSHSHGFSQISIDG
jgi:hypothetical protein